MSEIITSQIAKIKEQVRSLKSTEITDERAFSHLILKVFYKQEIYDHIVTDGKDDGGIDFIFYNDEENKLILGQSKYTSSLSFNEIRLEYEKMYSTYCCFRNSNTGGYNADVKRELQNGIDQLPEDNSGTVEYCLFTTADNVDEEDTIDKIGRKMPNFPVDSVKIVNKKSIEKAIEADFESVEIVENDEIEIDKPRNWITYESSELKGIMCNVKSSSIVQLYNKYQNYGLFDRNIRRFVPNKQVDSGINNTLKNDQDNFWFLNNGIIIACEDFCEDGNTIKLSNFSIVNGGQTTQLIGEYKGVLNNFAIPCKIVTVKNKNEVSDDFFNRIAAASNSQKPIFPRDLRANSKEMISLAKWLSDEKIYLEIKRGSKKPKQGKFKYSIKNDELGQLLLSFVHQKPGTSRSGKRTMFDNPDIYGKLFRENYRKTTEKKQCLLDIIKLNIRYKELESKYKNKDNNDYSLDKGQSEILKNGKQTIFAFLGLCYMLANDDITNEQVISDSHYADGHFKYGPILSNYKKDDLDEKFDTIVYTIIDTLSELYSKAFEDNKVSSVSNFMKTDTRYYSDMVKKFITSYFKYTQGKTIKENWDIFKRE